MCWYIYVEGKVATSPTEAQRLLAVRKMQIGNKAGEDRDHAPLGKEYTLIRTSCVCTIDCSQGH